MRLDRHKTRTYSEPDNCWILLAVANLLLAMAFLVFFILITFLAAYSPTAQAWDWPTFGEDQKPTTALEVPPAPPPKREKAPPPPDIQPYQIPTLSGEKKDFHYVPSIKMSKIIDADALFTMIVNCFPERPKWGIELKAVAGARYSQNNTVSTFDTAGLSKYYAGIVAEMPLYSTEELNKQRTQEYQRRGEVATNVAALLKALADRDRALRLVGIEEAAEARSQLRVREGLAPAEEQMALLREVASKTSDLVTANASITAARLTLIGQCRDEVTEQVNDYLKDVIQ